MGPARVFVNGHEPLVIALAKFRERFLAGLFEYVQIVVEMVALDGLSRGFIQAARHVPLLFDASEPFFGDGAHQPEENSEHRREHRGQREDIAEGRDRQRAHRETAYSRRTLSIAN